MNPEATVYAVKAVFWMIAFVCAIAVVVWWVREGRAESRVDAKARTVAAGIASRPRPFIVLPPDQARQSRSERFTGYQIVAIGRAKVERRWSR